jgi:hypothetical protein
MYFWQVIEAFDRYARAGMNSRWRPAIAEQQRAGALHQAGTAPPGSGERPGVRRVRYPVRMRAVRLLLT